MKRIVDNAGNVINGFYRQDGCIVVDDQDMYNKYKLQYDKDMRIAALERQVSMLFDILNKQKDGK